MLNDNSLMPYGIHKGKKMANVPAQYLLWCYQQSWCKGEVKEYIKENLDSLKLETTK